MGDPARQLPLRRGAPGRHRRHRARRRLRDALGLRHRAGPVRALAGRPAGSRSPSGCKEDIDAGKALCKAPLPAWVFDGPVAKRRRAHARRLVERRRRRRFVPRSTLPVYAAPASSARACSAAGAAGAAQGGTEVFEDDEVRVWTLDGEVLIASITDQAAPDQPGRDRGPAQGGRARRERATRAW